MKTWLVRLTEKVVRITQVMGNTRMHSSKCTNLKKCDFSYLLSSLSSYGDDIFSLESLKRNILLFSMDTIYFRINKIPPSET